ncbi:putative protein isoform X3 [Gossypium australe]|uniref:Uncharacterized protein n=1 Tax=Gossypium australe TaxID=47621 RepID=A0A5B6W8J3_9ROSI|nr:putative protein isoform X3 [Gossypium australe]
MSLGVEVAVMGWDLSLQAQSKRALAMNSIWLREDGEDDKGESLIAGRNLENRPWGMRNKLEIGVSIDPVLGINLEGICPSSSQWGGGNLLAKQAHSVMEHDLEERVQIGKEGKKRHRGESEDQTILQQKNYQKASRPIAMKILIWNVCGLRNLRKLRRLRHTLKTYNP